MFGWSCVFARDEYVFRGRSGGRKKRAPSPPKEELKLTGIAEQLNLLVRETGIYDMDTDPKKFS